MYFKFKKLYQFIISLIIGAFLLAGNAHAVIISTTGNLNLISAPTSVERGNLQSDTDIFGFSEVQNYTLTSDLYVNGMGAGTYMGTGTAASDVIGAGTMVNSYLFHADSITTLLSRFTATATFEEEIIGIIFERADLNSTDSILGNVGTTYSGLNPNSDYREFEAGAACGVNVVDCATISGDLRTLSLDLGTTSYIDQIRVITRASVNVPEPSSLILLLASFIMFRATRNH